MTAKEVKRDYRKWSEVVNWLGDRSTLRLLIMPVEFAKTMSRNLPLL